MRRLGALLTIAGAMLLWIFGAGVPAWADGIPVDGKIAFTQNPEDEDAPSGFTIDPDGSNRRQVGATGSTECTAWAPDGSALLCNDWSAPLVRPATADPDASNFTPPNPNLPLDLFCTGWSPDGSRILCHTEGNPDPADAGRYTLRSSDGGDLGRATTTPSGSFDIANGYSPDGLRILYSRFRSEDAPGTLFSVRPNGSGRIRLSLLVFT